MRHRVYGKHLGRDKNQRSALFKGLIRSLILHESITTTESKAKAIKGLVDTLVAKGKRKENTARQFIQSLLPDKEISEKLVSEIASRYPNRTSGFTSLVKLGRRLGDGAMIVKMSLVEGEKEVKTEKAKVKNASQNEKVTSKEKTKETISKKVVKEKSK